MSRPYAQSAVIIDLPADADYSAKQYYGMDVEASTGNAKLVAAAGAKAIGVLMDVPDTAGKMCRVAVGGVVPCVAGDTVTAGDLITFNASGKGIPATASYVDTSDGGGATDPVIGSYVIGRALSGAAASAQFNLLIQPLGSVPTTAV